MAQQDLSGRMLGEYRLGSRIGQGGYGVVYHAEQLPLRRQCVVKVLLEDRLHSDSARLRFRREAELASRLDHPYAAHVLAFGTEGDIHTDDRIVWIAMELVRGVTLSDWMTKHGPMPIEQFVPFFEALAEVVQTAHDLGIVHRDIKPSNIMVIERAGRIFPKLLDLGIAKPVFEVQSDDSSEGSLTENVSTPAEKAWTPRTAPIRLNACLQTMTDDERSRDNARPSFLEDRRRLTLAGTRVGTWGYMSPEQWRDSPSLGPATDLYALGIVAYELLTGHSPFSAETADEYCLLHCREPMPPIGSPVLDPILARALAKSPQGRQGSVMELAAEFRTALRAIEREHLRSAARTWADRGRASRLLWGNSMLVDFERTRTRNARMLTDLEYEFIEASQRRARRSVWLRRGLLGLIAVSAVAQYRAGKNAQLADERTRSARKLTEIARAKSELEQGRAALLHGEPDAFAHLAAAYQSEATPSTAFMLARASQPRLAERARFPSSFERMWSAAFSPDGRQLVTTDDRNAELWDAQTYRLLFKLNHGDVVYHAVYSADGSKLVTGCGDGAVRIWDTTNGKLLHELRRHSDRIPRYYVVALSPDGRLVAGIDSRITHVWNAETGAEVTELREDARYAFPALAFSFDGRWLAKSTGDEANVFDTQTWTRVGKISESNIHNLAWDPTRSHLLTGSGNGDVSIWEIPSGERIHHLHGFGESVDAVAFAPGGRFVAAASRDGLEQVWDATSAELQYQSVLQGKSYAIEFDRTSTLIAASSAYGAVTVNDVVSGIPVMILNGHSAVVKAVHFDPAGKRVLSASWDGTARIWDITGSYRQWRSSSISDDCGAVSSAEPDRRFLAIRCNERPTQIWDTLRGRLIAKLPNVTAFVGDFSSVYPVISIAGDRAAIARGNAVEIYELPSARLLRTTRHDASVTTVAFAAEGRDVVSGAADGSAIVTRDNGALTVLPTSFVAVDVAGFLTGGRVAVVDAQQRLRIYDVGGSVLADLRTRARVEMLRMSSDGRRLVTTSTFTGKVTAPELWDVEHYRLVSQLATHGQGQVYSDRFVAGGGVLTACGDGAARLWDAETGRLRQTYRGGSRFLADATLTADGAMVIGGGGGGQLRFWEASSGRPLWTMPAHRSDLVGVHVDVDGIVTRGFAGDLARWTLPDPEQVIAACARDARCALSPAPGDHPSP